MVSLENKASSEIKCENFKRYFAKQKINIETLMDFDR